MSFYFYIKTTQRPEPQEILDALDQPDVRMLETDDGDVAFYLPGRSLRGAIFYKRSDGYEIGVNAFTPACDAVLARDLAACLGTLTEGDVTPEDSDDALPASDIASYGGDAWVADRVAEARHIIEGHRESNPKGQSTIFGYRQPYNISLNMLKGKVSKPRLDAVMADGIALQEIENLEDIYVARMFLRKRPTNWNSVIERVMKLFKPSVKNLSQTLPNGTAIFALAEGVRTLTPTHMSDALYAVLGDDDVGFRAVPFNELAIVARKANAREYGIGTFDLTLTGKAYHDLYAQGTPL